MWRLFRTSTSIRLHRWCHPNSDKYRATCDQARKAMLANRDNCYLPPPSHPRPPKPDVTRDPISVFLVM